MKQILHIFAKDVRRLRIEILISFVSAALFAWAEPKTWFRAPGVHIDLSIIVSLAYFLVIVGWGLLIARLIHGEALVGDRQFWVTRPYEWPSLLAAKAFFIALFLYLPFFLMLVSILMQAGFNPLSYLPGLLYRILLISAIYFLLIGLAAVTLDLGRMVLTILGAGIVLAIGLTPFTHINTYQEPTSYSHTPLEGLVIVLVVILLCGTVTVLQYVRRRALAARLLLGSTPIFILLASFLYTSIVPIDRVYPPAVQSQPPVIQIIPFDPNDVKHNQLSWSISTPGSINVNNSKWVTIQINMRAAGVAAGDRWQLDAIRPILTPPNGVPLKMDWEQAYAVFDKPDNPNQLGFQTLSFHIRRADADRLKTSPVTLHLDFALTQAQPARTWRFPLTRGDFMIPDFGSCSTYESGQVGIVDILSVFCRFPLRQPAVTTVMANETKGPCELAATPLGDPALPASMTLGDFDVAPASFGISPMEERVILNGNNYFTSNGKPSIQARLCPGTPIVVTQYRKVRTVQTSISIGNFYIPG